MPLTPLTWRNQQTVNLTTTGTQSDPEIIQLANGNILVSWTTSDLGGLGSPNGNETFAQIYDPLGNKIGGEIRLNQASTGDDEQNADMTALPNGGFIVVYHDLDNPASVPAGASNIRLEEYDANGVQVAENALVVSDSTLGGDPNYRNPVVAASSNTSVLIVYEEISGGVPNVRGKIYDPSTDTYSAQISLIASPGGNTDADVVALTNGNYVVVARNTSADTSIIYRIVNSTGGNVLGVTFVTGTNSNTEVDFEPCVTALTGGGFVIAYTNTDAIDTDVEFRVYNAVGTQIGSGFAGSDGATDDNNESKVIALADGTFVIAWDDDDGVFGIDVQHFSATGGTLGAVFTVSADNVNSISGVGLGDGRFALVWDVSGGEISMEILDTRDVPNNPGVYTPDQWVVGTVGDDVFSPAGNAEITHGWDGNDTITENGGTRQYFGDNGNDRINVVSTINSDLHDGGANTDTIDWSGSSEVNATYNLAAGTATNATNTSTEQMLNFENLNGTNNKDTIIGTAGVNILNGNGGDDLIYGGVGPDIINGGGGFDYASFEQASAGVYANLAAGTGFSGEATGDTYTLIEGILGSGFNDIFVGDNSLNGLLGGAGVDYMYGLGGNDNIYGQGDGDYLEGGLGADYLDGGTGYDYAGYAIASAGVTARLDTNGVGNAGEAAGDTYVAIEGLYGSNYADLIVGNASFNVLVGGTGADQIYGNGGGDYLNGGTGNDAFLFDLSSFQAGVFNYIQDFAEGAGNVDYLYLYGGLNASNVIMTTVSGGTFISTAALGYSGGIVLLGFTAAQLADQIFYV